MRVRSRGCRLQSGSSAAWTDLLVSCSGLPWNGSSLDGHRPTWRRHPWVVLIWLLAAAAAVALLVVMFTGGWGKSAFYGWMLLTIVRTSIHEGLVRLYER